MQGQDIGGKPFAGVREKGDNLLVSVSIVAWSPRYIRNGNRIIAITESLLFQASLKWTINKIASQVAVVKSYSF